MGIYSDTGLSQETQKISNNLTLCLKQLSKKEASKTKPKVRRRKEIIKITAETKGDFKKREKRLMKLKASSLKR